jgi:[NiFe] hydrogenase diaphorase moiety small subunit
MTVAAFAVGAPAQGSSTCAPSTAFLVAPLGEALARRRAAGCSGARSWRRAGFDFDIEHPPRRRRVRVRRGVGADRVARGQARHPAQPPAVPGDPRLPGPADGGQQRRDATAPRRTDRARRRAPGAPIGTPKSAGTKLHVGVGRRRAPRHLRVPVRHGAAGPRGRRRARHPGGAGRRAVGQCCLAAREFGRRIAFEDVPTAGAFMVFDRSRDMFEVARTSRSSSPTRAAASARRAASAPRWCARMDKLATRPAGLAPTTSMCASWTADARRTHCGLGATACNPLRDTLAEVPAGLRAATCKSLLRRPPSTSTPSSRRRRASDRPRRPGGAPGGGMTDAPCFTARRRTTCPSCPATRCCRPRSRAGHYIPHLCWHPTSMPTAAAGVHREGQRPHGGGLHHARRAGGVVENRTDELDAHGARRWCRCCSSRATTSAPRARRAATAAAGHRLRAGHEGPHFEEFYPDRPVDASHPDAAARLQPLHPVRAVRARQPRGRRQERVRDRGPRHRHTHLVVNSDERAAGRHRHGARPTGRDVCPVGVILPKRRGFAVPIGERRYDQDSVAEPDPPRRPRE